MKSSGNRHHRHCSVAALLAEKDFERDCALIAPQHKDPQQWFVGVVVVANGNRKRCTTARRNKSSVCFRRGDLSSVLSWVWKSRSTEIPQVRTHAVEDPLINLQLHRHGSFCVRCSRPWADGRMSNVFLHREFGFRSIHLETVTGTRTVNLSGHECQKGGFPGARRTHNCCQVPVLELARNALHNGPQFGMVRRRRSSM